MASEGAFGLQVALGPAKLNPTLSCKSSSCRWQGCSTISVLQVAALSLICKLSATQVLLEGDAVAKLQ